MNNLLQLQLILTALDRVSGPCRKISADAKNAGKALSETRDKLKELNATQKQVADFRVLTGTLDKTAAILANTRKKTRELALQINQAKEPSKALTKEFEQARATVVRLKEQHEAETRRLQQLRTELSGAGIDTRRLSEGERTLRNTISSTNAGIEQQKERLAHLTRQQDQLNAARERYGQRKELASNLAAAGAGGLALGSAALAGLSAPIRAYADFEDAGTQLNVSMMGTGGAVRKEFGAINALANHLGDRLPGTTADFQDMMTMLIRMGITSKQILGGVGEATAYLGVQLKMAPVEAAQFAAKLQEATRTTEGDMMGLMDVIQRTFYVGVDQNDMLQAFAKLSPAMDIIKQKGLAGAQALAPLVVMANQAGMAGEAAGNAYRKVFQMSMNAKKVNAANGMLGHGMKLDFTNGKGEFGGLPNMFKQLEKLRGVSTQQQLAVIKKIFGDDAETLQVVSLLINKGQEGYNTTSQKMADQAALQQRVNAQLGTLKNLWEAASGTFTNALAAFGEAISPELKDIVGWLADAAAATSAWAREHPVLAGYIMKTIAVIGLLLIAFGAITVALATVLGPLAIVRFGLEALGIKGFTAFGLLKSGFTSIFSTLARLTTFMMANPIFAALALLAIAAYLIYQNWDDIRDFFVTLWAGVVDVFNRVWPKIKNILLNWTPWGWMLQIGESIIDGIWTGLTNRFPVLKDWMSKLGAMLPDWLRKLLGINSPSRVFAEIGGHTMTGLAKGMDDHAHKPLQSIRLIAGHIQTTGARISQGLAAGALAGTVAMSAPASAAPGGNTYIFQIHAAPGMDEKALVKLLEKKLRDLDRQRDIKARGALHDKA